MEQKQSRRRPFFAGYTDHMLNFFCSTLPTAESGADRECVYFKSEVDEQNWVVCSRLWQKLGKTERRVVHQGHNARHEDRHGVVGHLADDLQMAPEAVWRIDYRVQYALAVLRGLIAKKDVRREDVLYE